MTNDLDQEAAALEEDEGAPGCSRRARVGASDEQLPERWVAVLRRDVSGQYHVKVNGCRFPVPCPARNPATAVVSVLADHGYRLVGPWTQVGSVAKWQAPVERLSAPAGPAERAVERPAAVGRGDGVSSPVPERLAAGQVPMVPPGRSEAAG